MHQFGDMWRVPTWWPIWGPERGPKIKLNQQDMEEANKEKLAIKSFYNHNDVEFNAHVDKEIGLRYPFSNYLISPNRFRFRKVIRILGLVCTFIKKASKDRIQNNKIFHHACPGDIRKILQSSGDKYIVTTGYLNDMGSSICAGGKVIEFSNDMLKSAMFYFSTKASLEVQHFLKNEQYDNY